MANWASSSSSSSEVSTPDGSLPLAAGILLNESQLNTPFGGQPYLIGVTLNRDTTAIAEMVGKEKILEFEALSCALERAKAIYHLLNAVVKTRYEEALKETIQPNGKVVFGGVPIFISYFNEYKGMPI